MLAINLLSRILQNRTSRSDNAIRIYIMNNNLFGQSRYCSTTLMMNCKDFFAGSHFRITIFSLCSVLLTFSGVSAAGYAQDPLVPLHVEKGMSVIHIAKKYCVNTSAWKIIARINHLQRPYTIYANTTLRIPASLLIKKNISARVASVSGSPRVVKSGQAGDLHKGDLVYPGQTVVTGQNEYVHLVYPDHKHTRIGAESEMTLVYLMTLADNNLQAEFSLEKGNLTHQINERLQVNEHFETRTPVAITGVRGTEYRLKVVDQEVNIVETLKGKVAVKASGWKRVLPRGKGLKVKKGQPLVKANSLPAVPTILKLKDIYRVMPLEISVPDHPTAQSFKLRVARDVKGLVTIQEITAAAGERFVIPLLADGHYYVFLTAVDSAGFESLSTPAQEIQVRTSPAAPIVSKPKTGLETFDTSIKIRWLQSDGAASYRVQIATDSEFLHIIDEQEMKKSFFVTSKLEPGEYFFRVQLQAEDGFFTLYSEIISWKVMEPPKMGSMAPQPSDDGTIVLRWPVVPQATLYMLQVATDKKFRNLIVNEDALPESSFTLTQELEAGDYYIRIRTVTESGQFSPWTPPLTMTLDPEPLGLGHLLLAVGFAVLVLL